MNIIIFLLLVNTLAVFPQDGSFKPSRAEAEAAARAQWKLDAEQKRIDELATFKAWQAEQQAIRAAARAEGRSLITEVNILNSHMS